MNNDNLRRVMAYAFRFARFKISFKTKPYELENQIIWISIKCRKLSLLRSPVRRSQDGDTVYFDIVAVVL